MEETLENKLETVIRNTDNLASREFIAEVITNLVTEFKNREIKLCNKFEAAVRNFELALHKRDDKIAELECKIAKLTPNFTEHALADDTDADGLDRDIAVGFIKNNCDNTAAAAASLADDSVSAPSLVDDSRENLDLLIIGDSIVKHLDIEKIMPGGKNLLKCIRGARAHVILSNFAELSQKYNFKRVIMHIGTNYIPSKSSTYIRREMMNLMEALQDYRPETYFSFSEILPKLTGDYYRGIGNLNRMLKEECHDRRAGFIEHWKFGWGYDRDQLFIKRDGIHPNYRGVATLESSMAHYLRRKL